MSENGILIEEYITYSQYFFRDSEKLGVSHDSSQGEYTGRFCFEFSDGKTTRWYTAKSAPKWLLRLYRQIGCHQDSKLV